MQHPHFSAPEFHTTNPWLPTSHRTVADVLQTVPVLLSPQAYAVDVRRVASRSGLHHFAVVDESDGCLGVVCRCSLRAAPRGTMVADCMRRPALTIASDTRLSDATRILLEKGVGSLPVLYDGVVVGLLTRAWLAEAGLLMEGAAPKCAQCGTYYHVAAVPHPAAAICRRCKLEGPPQLDSSERDEEADELGFGD